MQSKALRAFEPVKPITIYRVAGRRPSDVWVDASGTIAGPGPDCQQLKELVYWRTHTVAEDEIQDRLGGMFLVQADGQCHPISLVEPTPLKPETAFIHAQSIRNDDSTRIEELLANGDVIAIAGRRPTTLPSRPSNLLVPANHPLVVDERPPEIDKFQGATRNERMRR